VALSGLTPSSATADQNGDQTFTATLDTDGFPGTIGFSPVGAQDPTLTHWTISGGTATFTVHSGAKDRPATPFTVRADLPTGFTDYTPGNDSASSTYTYATTPLPNADVNLTLNELVPGNSGKGAVVATVKGVPDKATMTLVLTYDPTTVEVVSACPGSAGVLRCTLPGGTSVHAFGVALVDRPGAHGVTSTLAFDVIGNGYTEVDPSNNHGEVVLSRR
jgi:hypothetical protein